MENKKFNYNGSIVEFEVENKMVMVNATEMAAIFGKLTKDFLRNESTILFISECLKKENSPFLGIEKEEDLYTSKQKSGTWMHRLLALKFAAWLNPAFELWVYCTIDQILFQKQLTQANYFTQKEELNNQKDTLNARMKTLRNLLKNSPEGVELAECEKQLAEVKAKLAALEHKMFGTQTSFYDQLPEATE